MRLWSLAPALLDSRGLVALWREALLARKVVQGLTRGYRHHPQLLRFAGLPDPERALNLYLAFVWQESLSRGWNFDAAKLPVELTGAVAGTHEEQESRLAGMVKAMGRIRLTEGQVDYELEHLQAKLQLRSPKDGRRLEAARARGATAGLQTLVHPLFVLEPGPVADWEIRRPAV